MRWTVRESEPPFDTVGYVEAPPPEDVAKSGFRHGFRLSRFPSGHRLHFAETLPAQLVLEVGVFKSHGETCRCGTCPPGEAAFMSMGHPIEVLRQIVGFHPVTVLRVGPAGMSMGATRG